MNTRKIEAAEHAYTRMCKHLGITLTGDAKDTPRRVVKFLLDMTANTDAINSGKLNFKFTTFDSKKRSDIVVCRNIEFVSLCQHHHLPFVGMCDVAYLPNAKIVGLSKIGRTVEYFSRCATVQEEFTARIAEFILDQLSPKAVYVVTKAMHSCVCARTGQARQETIVSTLLGKDAALVKDEMLQLMKG